MSPTCGDPWEEVPLAPKNLPIRPRLLPPVSAKTRRAALPSRHASTQRNVEFSRSLGTDINQIWWKSCENEAEATATTTLWRFAPRYGRVLSLTQRAPHK